MKLVTVMLRGQSLIRALMNERCRRVSLKGMCVLDLGAGSKKGSYHDYFAESADTVITADMKNGDGNHKQLNFETDRLPFNDASFDGVLAFNLFEHIYNHVHLVQEANRVTRHGGKLIGFVPFLVNYHPDPHDYFRYTPEALRKIFTHAGYSDITIEEIGRGPFAVNYNNVVLSIPKIVRVLILPLYWALDSVFLTFRPQAGKRYALGYFFTAVKK